MRACNEQKLICARHVVPIEIAREDIRTRKLFEEAQPRWRALLFPVKADLHCATFVYNCCAQLDYAINTTRIVSCTSRLKLLNCMHSKKVVGF